jgi:hypothetical protein
VQSAAYWPNAGQHPAGCLGPPLLHGHGQGLPCLCYPCAIESTGGLAALSLPCQNSFSEPGSQPGKCLLQAQECPIDHQAAAQYFHIQRCIDGFDQMLRALMGISMLKLPLETGASPQCHDKCLPPSQAACSRGLSGWQACCVRARVQNQIRLLGMQVRLGRRTSRRSCWCMKRRACSARSTWICTRGMCSAPVERMRRNLTLL